MPWWAWLWVAVIALWTAAAITDDWNHGRPLWDLLLSGAAAMCGVIAIRAHFVDAMRSRLGRMLLPASLLGLTWVVTTTAVDVWSWQPDSGLSPVTNAVVVILATACVVLVIGLPLGLGIWRGREHW